MVIRLEIEKGFLVGKNEKTGEMVTIGRIRPLVRRKNPMIGRERWKDGSLMTGQQAKDEEYQKRNKIS